ncbi:MAG: glycosyltransferase family 2 protein [Candidatus Paceibacterota bacterium]|jgi:glycosyltransferase involved in cell wall biosynthesis
MKTKELTIIIPVYNEEATMQQIAYEISHVCNSQNIHHEIIFANDGSTDATLKNIQETMIHVPEVSYVSFEKNTGKTETIVHALKKASGEKIIIIDGDLQDDPADIPRIYNKLILYDYVSGWRNNRQDLLTKKLSSTIINFLIRKIFTTTLHDHNCSIKGFRKNLVQTFTHMKHDDHRFMPIIAHTTGFTISEIPTNHDKRYYGISKYGTHGFSRLKNTIISIIRIKKNASHI